MRMFARWVRAGLYAGLLTSNVAFAQAPGEVPGGAAPQGTGQAVQGQGQEFQEPARESWIGKSLPPQQHLQPAGQDYDAVE